MKIERLKTFFTKQFMIEVSFFKLDLGYISGATHFNELSISHGCQKDTVKWQKIKEKQKSSPYEEACPGLAKVGGHVKRLCKTKVC